MSDNTITTWGGRELPEHYEIEIYSLTCVRLWIVKNDMKLREPQGSWFFLGKDWRFGFTQVSELTSTLLFIISIMPNAAPEYIAWCHEQGIEVPGGEVKRVEVKLPVDVSGVWMNNWEPP